MSGRLRLDDGSLCDCDECMQIEAEEMGQTRRDQNWASAVATAAHAKKLAETSGKPVILAVQQPEMHVDV